MRVGVNGRAILEPGGSPEVGRKITKNMVDLKEIDDVTIYGPKKLEENFECPVNSRGYILENQFFGAFWEQAILPSSVDSNHDVLYYPAGNAPIVRDIDTPIVMVVHGAEWLHGHAPKLYTQLQRIIDPRSMGASDMLITPSEFAKREVIDNFDINPGKVRVVHNGIDSFFMEEGGESHFKLPDEYILFVGAMTGRKNIRGLVEAYKRIKGDVDEKLVIIGPKNSPNLEDTEVTPNDLDDPDIIMPGYVSKGELKYAYSKANLFVLPSFHEAFGLVPLESIACGTPVAVSNSAALPEVLGDAADYFDPNNTDDIEKTLRELLTNKDLQGRKIEKREEKASQFSWEKSAKETLEVLKLAGGR